MASCGEVFDVVAVVGRAQRMDLAVASEAELAWADRAGDRIRGWLDAWQAQVQFEQTLPRPLPDLPAPDPQPAGGDASSDDASSDDVTDSDNGNGNGSPVEGVAGRGEGPSAEPLPSLGAAPDPHESRAERERKARRSWLLSALSAFAAALRAGRITTTHVDLLAAAIDKLPPAIRDRVVARGDELLAAALLKSPERFSRTVQLVIAAAYADEGIDRAATQRARAHLRRGVDDATKMHWLHLELDPERGSLLFRQLDAEREALFHAGHHQHLTSEQLELHALLNLLGNHTTRTAAGAPPAPAVRTQKSSTKKLRALVLIDIDTLLERAHHHTVCETGAGVPLPPDTVRRLLCIAETTYGLLINGRIVASVANNDLATPDQRHQLRMMYRTCCHPDCDRRFDHCQIHHIIARSRHGPTDTALMVPLCSEHHDAIHHHGWTLTIDTHRNLTWTAPNGTPHLCPFTPLADLDQPTLFTNQPGRAPPPAA